MKKCISCKELLPLEEFNKNRSRKDGLQVSCKTCGRKELREGRKRLREECINKLGGKCCHCGISNIELLVIDHINGGGRKEYKKIGQHAIIRKILDSSTTDRYQVLCQKCNLIKKRLNKECDSGIKQYVLTEIIWKCKTCNEELDSALFEKLSRVCRICRATKSRDRYKKIKNQVYDILGNKCKLCGEDNLLALEIDHILNNGNSERKSLSDTSFFRKVISTPSEYQILCRNCNWTKYLSTKIH